MPAHRLLSLDLCAFALPGAVYESLAQSGKIFVSKMTCKTAICLQPPLSTFCGAVHVI